MNFVVSSHSLGCPYVIAHLLASIGIYTGWTIHGEASLGHGNLQLLPTVITALLDEEICIDHHPCIIARKYLPSQGAEIGYSHMRSLLGASGQLLSERKNESSGVPGSDFYMEMKLSSWAGGEWGTPWTLEERRGIERITEYALKVKAQAEFIIGSNWSVIADQLRGIQMVKLDREDHIEYVLSRLTATQTGIMVRLGIPLPSEVDLTADSGRTTRLHHQTAL